MTLEFLQALIAWLFVLAVVGFFAWCFWSLACHDRTCRHREKVRRAIERRNGRSELYGDFDWVSHDEHAWRLRTFRDPWVIYPASIRALVQEKTS